MLNKIVLLIFAALAIFSYGRHYEHLLQEEQIAKLNIEVNASKEKSDKELYIQKESYETKLNKLNTAVANGSQRLFVPIKGSTCSSDSGTASSSRNDQTRAELDGQTSQDLIAITSDGDKAIIDLNSCIDRYNEIRNIIK